MQNMPIGIFRGDDTDAFSYQTIVGTIKTDLDLTGCRAVFRYLDFSMEFDPIPEDKKITIVIPADETKKFPPGLGYASLRVYDSEDRLKTFSNRIMVFVATKTPMFGSDEFEVYFNVRATLEPLKFFVGPNPDDFDEYRGYVKKVIDRASAEKYGLAILLDAIDSDLGAADGVAATPVAVKAAYAAIIKKLTDDYYTAEQTDEAIDRVAAYYITYDAAGNPFPTRAALLSAQTMYSGGEVRTPTRNDYAIVLADETHDGSEYRYIYAVPEGQTTGSWQPQYPVEGVMTVDQDVVRGSQNPVSGGGVWSMLWGNLQFIPEGLSSVYAWVLNRLGLKRDYTDLSYDTTETVEVPALHSVMTVGGQTIEERDLLCTEEVPDPPQIGHTYTWRSDGAAFYVTQGVSALQTTWILYSQNGEALDGVTTQNATQGFYPDVDFRPSGAVITIHKTTAQKQVTTEDTIALESKTVPTSRTVNGKALTGNVTLTGADIAVSGTDATKISAALAGKATKADATLNERGFSEWTITATNPAFPGPYSLSWNANQSSWDFYSGSTLFGAVYNSSATAVSATLTQAESTYVATRTALQGYTLGSQTDKPLASEAEAEALRAGKRDYDDLSYSFALTDYPKNTFVVSNANIADKDGEYTYTTPQEALVPVVGWYKGGATGGLWFELRGSTIIAAGPSAVDLDASLAEQDVTMPIEGSSPPEYFTFHLLRRVTNDSLALDSEKANRAPNPTAGNLAALDASGNPVDSGVKASDKLDSTSAAPAFSSDSSVSYPVGSHVTYNGKLYVCTTATTGGNWDAGQWAEDTMTDPDAVLDITSQNQLRVVAKDGTLLWAQGYDLASTSSATLACDAANNFTFADGATSQAFALPTAPTGKVGDFGLDIDNSANTGAATITLTGLDTAFSVVIPKGESLTDMFSIAAGELAQFYFTLSTFRVNNLPTWHILKQVVENGGAQS